MAKTGLISDLFLKVFLYILRLSEISFGLHFVISFKKWSKFRIFGENWFGLGFVFKGISLYFEVFRNFVWLSIWDFFIKRSNFRIFGENWFGFVIVFTGISLYFEVFRNFVWLAIWDFFYKCGANFEFSAKTGLVNNA